MSMRSTYDKLLDRSRQVWIRDSDEPSDAGSMPDHRETLWELAATLIGIIGIFTLIAAWVSFAGYH